MSGPKRLRRNDRGFSALELLVAVVLSTIVGVMTAGTLKVARHEVNLTIRSGQQNDLRQGMERSLRQIRNARTLGYCIDPPSARYGGTGGCRRVGERTFQLVSAKPNEVCYYAESEKAASGALTSPDLACLRVDAATNNLVVATRRATANATYTTPEFAAQEDIRRVSPVDVSLTKFRYYLLDDPNPYDELTTVTELQSVGLVEITLGVTGKGRLGIGAARNITQTVTYQAAPRGSRLQREQTYKPL